MKKLIIPILAISLLCGCDRTQPSPTIPTDPTESVRVTTAPPTRPPVIVPEVEEVPVVDNPLYDPWDCEVLVGQWAMTVTLSSNHLNLLDFTGTASFPLTWSFDEDGRYTVTLEQESFETAIIGYENQLVDYMMDGYYTRFVAEKKISSLSDEEIARRWDETERHKAQVQTHSYLDQLALGTTYSRLVRSGYYYVVDGVLHLTIGEEEETFSFEVDEEGLALYNSSRSEYYDRPFGIRFRNVLKPVT